MLSTIDGTYGELIILGFLLVKVEIPLNRLKTKNWRYLLISEQIDPGRMVAMKIIGREE